MLVLAVGHRLPLRLALRKCSGFGGVVGPRVEEEISIGYMHPVVRAECVCFGWGWGRCLENSRAKMKGFLGP